MADDKAVAAEPFKLQFHYIKGPAYHEVACHGAIGSPTPQGKIWMALYSERQPLPRMVEYHLPQPEPGVTSVKLDEGNATPAFIDSRTGIIRHVEFSTYLDIETAERLRDWLATQITQAKANAAK
jgi:hypothetical protein